MGDADPQADLAALERFVVDNDELLQLEERIGRFNIFDALSIVRNEIRHSNFLAWLLDPNESHGQGALFLRAVLMDLLKTARDNGYPAPASPIELDGAELRGVRVQREWFHIDLLVTCDEPNFAIAVENKIDAGLYNDFDRYERAVRQAHPEKNPMFVLLTTDGDEPTDEDWTPYSYADLHRVLSRCRRTHAVSIGDDVLTFLDHYLNLIGSRLMDDRKIDELCRLIYTNHRRAIDLIVELAGPGTLTLPTSVEHELMKDDRWQTIYRGPRYVEYVPVAWDKLLPPLGKRTVVAPEQWMTIWFRVGKKQCFDAVRIAPAADRDLRRSIIERLVRDPDEFGLKSLFKRADKIGDNWATLGRINIERWGTDEEVDEEKVLRKVRAVLDKRAKQLAGIPDALRPIIEQWHRDHPA